MTTEDGTDLIAALLTEEPARPGVAADGATLHFTIRRFVLQILLDKAATVVPNRDVMPVLRNFRIEVQPGRIRVVATDMELSMIATTEMVTVHAPGVAVFPARRMLDILREAEDGDVSVHVATGTAQISIGRTSWRLKLQGGHDYPAMPEIHEVVFTAVEREPFAKALAAVRYAASRDANRASLMMIDVSNGRMTACDGSRFAQTRVRHLPFDFRIPIGAVDDLTRLFKLSDLENIQIGESANHLIFKFAHDVFIVAKLVAQFPDMEAVLLRPAMANKHHLTVDRKALIAAVKRVRINADPETSAVALSLFSAASGGSCQVTGRDKYGNQASETIEAGWAGPARTIVVNHSFLLDMLAGYSDESASFRLGEDTRTKRAPVLLHDPNTGAVAVVQQMVSDWVGA